MREQVIGRLLENKNAIVVGASGHLGSAVAKTFATEGATAFLVGRTEAPLRDVADAAAVLASDRASGITASIVNVISGITAF